MNRLPTGIAPRQFAGIRLFEQLPVDALAEVADSAQVRPAAGGTTLFTQGEPATRCHALLSGCVRIAQSGVDGGQLVVRFIGPGQMFGGVALFTDRLYPASAVTVLDSVEASWTEQALLKLVHRHPQIALNLVKIIGTRLREVQERLREISSQRVEQRISRMLLRILEQSGHANMRGQTIAFPLTRQDIATMCGATLHTASRVLKSWEKAGFLATRRSRLTILKPDELRRIAYAPDRKRV